MTQVDKNALDVATEELRPLFREPVSYLEDAAGKCITAYLGALPSGRTMPQTSESTLKAYWGNSPSPYENDTEDRDAAVKHIEAIVASLPPPAGDVGDMVDALRKKAFRGPTMDAVHLKTVEWKAADALTAQAARIAQLEAADERTFHVMTNAIIQRDREAIARTDTEVRLAECEWKLQRHEAHEYEHAMWAAEASWKEATARAERLEAAAKECFAVLEAFGRASDGHVSPAVWKLHDAVGVMERTRAALSTAPTPAPEFRDAYGKHAGTPEEVYQNGYQDGLAASQQEGT
jgi:hypothetical protein